MISHVKFQQKVYAYYRQHKRQLPWRLTTDPYRILVSEMMLQQTQVDRVVPKYQEFLKHFPTAEKLATASIRKILKVWSGLGYNRRALYLHDIAQTIINDFNGKIPKTVSELQALSGIGYNTASSIVVFAFNKPVTFIETNIRSVYIYHFFKNEQQVSDKQLTPLIRRTLDRKNPREWYWALMDYGSYLKHTQPNPSRSSMHHSRQAKFIGSNRQLRGQILKLLLKSDFLKIPELSNTVNFNNWQVNQAINQLVNEGFITQKGDIISLR